jgi:hypothetical protein
MKEENWGEWAEKYKPIPNHIDKDGTYFALDGVNYSFETYGEELKYIEKQNPKYVWTLIEEDGDQFIQNGKWHVNRLAYFVCKNPCDKEQGNEVFCYWVNDNEDTIVAWLESGDRELIADAKEMAERIYEEKGITKKRYEELIK